MTRYVFSGDISIAYQVMGHGECDIVMVPGLVSHVEVLHESPGYTAFLRRLSTFRGSQVIRNQGQSGLYVLGASISPFDPGCVKT